MSENSKSIKKVKAVSNKQRLMDKRVSDLEGTSKMISYMLQQVSQNMNTVGKELDGAEFLLTDLQYRFVVLCEQLSVDTVALDNKVTERKMKDFEKETERKDIEEGLTTAEVITKDSTVVITTTTEDEKEAIFRARLKMFAPGMEEYLKVWEGKKVGDVVESNIKGKTHKVSFLAISTKKEEVKQDDGQKVS